ncbi:diguanylate cyclase [Leeia sp. TBRC 13508]|uniref:diguanylate cyclase n=1 Tax=Leeia speluncae TaxID=2884804 RepID=A0ABS8D8U9_9NEIS|nr:diguanylate cyclase [Leeia speluncae]MCB6184547.1 diguanylate cyclase [Leeia speluncae]
MPRRLHTFRIRLTLIIGGLSILTSILLVTLLSNFAKQQVVRDSGHTLEGMANSVSYAITENLRERAREVFLLSKSNLLRENELTSPNVKERLGIIKSTYRFYEWVGVTDINGNVLSAANGLLEGKSVAERPWFKAAKTHPYIGDVHKAVLLAKLLNKPNTGEPLRFIDFAAPINHPNGSLKGVIGVHADWSWIGSIIQGAIGAEAKAKDISILITNADGEILYPFAAIGKETLPAWVKSPNRIKTTYQADNQTYLLSQIPINTLNASNLSWRVIVRQPLAKATESITQLNQLLIIAGILSTLIFMAVIYHFVSRISRPLEKLAEAALEIGSGNETPRFDMLTKTLEVAHLASALQNMSDSLLTKQHELEASYHSLEIKVAERTKELADLYHLAPVGYHTLDSKGLITKINDRELKLLGYERHEVEGVKPFSAFIHPAKLAEFTDKLAVLEAKLAVAPFDTQLVDHHGIVHTVQISANAVFDENDELLEIHSAVMDVSEIKSLEKELRNQEALSQAIVHTTGVGVLLYQENGTCILANEAAAMMVGATREGLLTQNFHQIKSWKETELYTRSLKALEGEPSQFTLSVQTTFGKQVDALASVMSLHHHSDTLLLVVLKDVSELMKANRELTLLARRDALTGIPNRLALNERVREEFLRMKRTGIRYCVLLSDVDFFKKINDTYGHETGDEVLRRIGQLLKQSVRESDFVARYGGEEFVILLPDTATNEAYLFAEKLRLAIAKAEMPGAGKVTMSFGLVTADLSNENEYFALGRADEALYEAKAGGRNKVVIGQST